MKYLYISVIIIFLLNKTNAQTGEWRLLDSMVVGGTIMTFNYIEIKCADDNHCIALGNYGWIDKPWARITTDGGKTWYNTLESNDVSKPFNMAYPDTSLCIISCDSGYFFRSTDKGFSWKKIKIDSAKRITRIHFYKNYYAALYALYLDNKVILFSNDKGENWERMEINVSNPPDTLVFGGLLDLWIDEPGKIKMIGIFNQKNDMFTYDLYITETTDNGDTWIRKKNKIPKYVKKMFFFDSLNGFLVGLVKVSSGIYSDYIVETTDGGDTWIPRLDTLIKGDSYGLSQIYFRDRMNGVALGPWFKLWKTSDGGITWKRDSAYANRVTGDYFADIALLSNGDILGVQDFDCQIWKYSEHWTSVNENITQINNNEIKIYPNPWMPGKDLRLSLNFSKETEISLSLYNNLGEEILKSKNYTITGKKELLITPDMNLSPGVYFIKINSGNNIFAVKKFIVLN
jgi:photosystem II stability/assembly factor-like uncharacterized protein